MASSISSSNLQANSMASRRPSKLSHIVAISRESQSANAAASLYDKVPRYTIRLPGLFRTRIPLIAVLPFFLLGFLFAPIQRFDPEEAGYSRPSSSNKARQSNAYPDSSAHSRFEWAQRFIPAAVSNSRQGDRTAYEHYTEEDGLLYFPPAASDNDPSEGVSSARASQPKQRHPILYLIEKGTFVMLVLMFYT